MARLERPAAPIRSDPTPRTVRGWRHLEPAVLLRRYVVSELGEPTVHVGRGVGCQRSLGDACGRGRSARWNGHPASSPIPDVELLADADEIDGIRHAADVERRRRP